MPTDKVVLKFRDVNFKVHPTELAQNQHPINVGY